MQYVVVGRKRKKVTRGRERIMMKCQQHEAKFRRGPIKLQPANKVDIRKPLRTCYTHENREAAAAAQ